MSDFWISGEQFFDAVSQPILLGRDGEIAYLNDAARTAFSQAGQPLAEGQPLPAPLPRSGGSLASVVLGQRRWTVEARAVEQGVVYLFSPEAETACLDAENTYLLSVNLKLTLSSMMAALESLQNEMVETELERNHDRFAALNQGYFRLLHTVDSLSLYSLAGQDPEDCWNPETLDLRGFCARMEEILSVPIRLTGHTFRLENSAVPLFVSGDRQLLERMVCQLCANAVQADGDITLRLAQQGRQGVLTISDNGHGIEDGVLSQGFSAQSSEGNPLPKGVGFGLPICYQIVRLHQGSLVITRRKKGTRVAIALPLLDPDESGLHLRSKSPVMVQGFPTVLVELSKVLPRSCYDPNALF